jgi:hypothetical protein
MNKKANTLLFILGATVFNILITILGFVALFALYVKFVMIHIPEEHRAWGFTMCFIAAIVLSFIAYRFALKLLMKKVDMEKYFDPIFSRRRK